MAKQDKQARAGSNGGPRSVFDTPGGRSYLENLQRLRPTETTKKAVDAAKKAEKRSSER